MPFLHAYVDSHCGKEPRKFLICKNKAYKTNEFELLKDEADLAMNDSYIVLTQQRLLIQTRQSLAAATRGLPCGLYSAEPGR